MKTRKQIAALLLICFFGTSTFHAQQIDATLPFETQLDIWSNQTNPDYSIVLNICKTIQKDYGPAAEAILVDAIPKHIKKDLVGKLLQELGINAKIDVFGLPITYQRGFQYGGYFGPNIINLKQEPTAKEWTFYDFSDEIVEHFKNNNNLKILQMFDSGVPPIYGFSAGMSGGVYYNFMCEFIKRNNIEMLKASCKSMILYKGSARYLYEALETAIEEKNPACARIVLSYLSAYDIIFNNSQWTSFESGYANNKKYPYEVCAKASFDYQTSKKDSEYKNESLIQTALKHGFPDIVMDLLDKGVDPYSVRTQNNLDYSLIETLQHALGTIDIYKVTRKDILIENSFEYAKRLGFTAQALQMEKYMAGRKLPNFLVNKLSVAIDLANYPAFDSLLQFDLNGKADYCLRDKKLLRRAFYTAGNKLFRDKQYLKAINYYLQGLTQGEGNCTAVNSQKQLSVLSLESWPKEGEPAAGAAFLAYNIACSYCQLGEIKDAYLWLKLAIRMDTATREYALSDSDLTEVRNMYGTDF